MPVLREERDTRKRCSHLGLGNPAEDGEAECIPDLIDAVLTSTPQAVPPNL